MYKKLGIASLSSDVRKYYKKELTSIFDDNVKISSYSFENNDFDIEENIEELKGLDIILVSTYSQYEILKKYLGGDFNIDRKSTRLNSSHVSISYAVFCLKKIIKQLDIK